MRASLLLVVICGVVLGATACTGLDETLEVGPCYGSSDVAPDQDYSSCRVFRGTLQLPAAKEVSLPARPFQIAAVGFEPLEEAAELPTDQVRKRFFFGAPFAADAGAGQRPSLPFSIAVPCGISVNFLLQVVRSGGADIPGIQVAQMSFEGAQGAQQQTTLIPWQPPQNCGEGMNQHDLGLVTLELARRHDLTSGKIELGTGNSTSPLDLVQTTSDAVTEGDADGNGILDHVESFAALADFLTPGAPPNPVDPQAPQPDGIPDIFQ